jgi:hypothetical protein
MGKSSLIAISVAMFLVVITAIVIYMFRYEITGRKHP